MIKSSKSFQKLFFIGFSTLFMTSCGLPDNTSSSDNNNTFSEDSNNSTKAFTITDSEVNTVPLTFPTSPAIQAQIDGLHLVNVSGPSSITQSAAPSLTSTADSYVACYYDKLVTVGSRSYRSVSWEWALDTSRSAMPWFYVRGSRYPDESFKMNSLYSYYFWDWTQYKYYTSTYNNIKSACLNTLNYRVGSGNYRFLYSTESQNSTDYNRPLFASNSTFATYFRRMVAFGDSLTDTANIYNTSLHALPAAPYYGGRFTNGYNWVDNISAILKIPIFNWAYGSAETGTSLYAGIVPSLKAAVNDYLTNKGVSTLGYKYGGYGDFDHTLFSVYAGGNNYIDFAQANSNATLAQQTTAVTTAISDLKSSIQSLINVGARFILVPNLPDLGAVPEGQPYSSMLASMVGGTNGHNAQLNAMVVALKTANPNANVTFIEVNVYKLLQNIIQQPTVYNLSNVTQPCYLNSSSYLSNASPSSTELCASPDNYLFWDQIHPTTRVHGFIAYALSNALLPGATNSTSLNTILKVQAQ